MDDTVTDGASAGGASPPDGTPAAAPRRLYRSRHERVVAGVAGGLGEYLGVDPVLVRIVFVLLVVAGGTGVLLYLAAWVLIPEEPEGPDRPAAAPRDDRLARWVGAALIVLAAVVVVDDLRWLDPVPLWPLVLIGLGVALFWRGKHDAEAPPAPPPAADDSDVTAPAAPPAASSGATPAATPRRASVLGLLTVGTALLAGGVGALLDGLEVVDLYPVHYLGLATLVVGIGLTVGAWWGRARWLIAVGVLLLPLLAGATLLGGTLGGGPTGEFVHRISTAAQLPADGYRVLAGELTLDLSDLRLEGRTTEVDARVSFGQLTVQVPRDVAVEVRATARGGEIHVFGETRRGRDVQVHRAAFGDRGQLVLDLQVGFGEIRVTHA